MGCRMNVTSLEQCLSLKVTVTPDNNNNDWIGNRWGSTIGVNVEGCQRSVMSHQQSSPRVIITGEGVIIHNNNGDGFPSLQYHCLCAHHHHAWDKEGHRQWRHHHRTRHFLNTNITTEFQCHHQTRLGQYRLPSHNRGVYKMGSRSMAQGDGIISQ